MEEDKKFRFPLYHGTSDLWIDSIKQFGLGGRNIINDYELKNMMEEANNYCEMHGLLCETEKYIISRILSSETGTMNWQYGNVYVSVCPDKAIAYALNNKYGSEFLSTIMLLDEKIRGINKSFKYKCVIHNNLIEHFRNASPKPVLLTLCNIDIKDLAPENGKLNLYEALDRVEKLYSRSGEDMSEFYLRASNSNFRLSKAIGWEKVTCCEYI